MRTKRTAPVARNAMALAIQRGLLGVGLLALAGAATAQSAPAQAEDAKTLESVEVVSTLGSRGQPRSESSSAVPIDIISGEEFRAQGTVDVLDQMRVMVPSFQVSIVPIDDGATLVRPANLRGLPPDSSLVW